MQRKTLLIGVGVLAAGAMFVASNLSSRGSSDRPTVHPRAIPPLMLATAPNTLPRPLAEPRASAPLPLTPAPHPLSGPTGGDDLRRLEQILETADREDRVEGRGGVSEDTLLEIQRMTETEDVDPEVADLARNHLGRLVQRQSLADPGLASDWQAAGPGLEAAEDPGETSDVQIERISDRSELRP